jgi:hypothetical protein
VKILFISFIFQFHIFEFLLTNNSNFTGLKELKPGYLNYHQNELY